MWIEIAIFVMFAIGVIYIVFHNEIKEIFNMRFEKKKESEVKETIQIEEVDAIAEEWIWVDGYKATNNDMTCQDYQYVLGERHDMPENAVIEECESGFHLCRDLDDVFSYYAIGYGHRFFKVRALVRKSDFERYGTEKEEAKRSYFYYSQGYYNKLVAKSIVFERELTPDEILKNQIDLDVWTDEDKLMALNVSIEHARERFEVNELIDIGFSKTFARHIIESGKYDIAQAVGSQPDLSMDMKCWLIFN